jgi:hypothetical protein
LNAGGSFDTIAFQPSSFYVNPIRYDSSYASYSNLYFNPATSEVVQGGTPPFTVPSNITVSNITASQYANLSTISTNHITFFNNVDIGTNIVSPSTGRTVVGGYAGGSNNTGKKQGSNTVAIGETAGFSQGNYGTAVGYQAAYATIGSNQGTGGVALGARSQLYGSGDYAIGIGFQAGVDNASIIGQSANSICINATGNYLPSGTASACFIKPLRGLLPYASNTSPPSIGGLVISSICYDPFNGELTYSDSRLFQQLFTSTLQASSITTSTIYGNYGSISTLSTQNLTVSSMSASTISTFALFASNASFSSILTSSISTFAFRALTANISSLYVSSISSFNTFSGRANFSTLNASSIIFTSTIGCNAQFSTLNTSSIVTARYNGALTGGVTMPKSYFSTATTGIGLGPTLTSYITMTVSTLNTNYRASATATILSASANNDLLTATFLVNGSRINFSTVKTNSGNNHYQQFSIDFGAALTASSTNTIALQLAASAGSYTACNATLTVFTNLL